MANPNRATELKSAQVLLEQISRELEFGSTRFIATLGGTLSFNYRVWVGGMPPFSCTVPLRGATSDS